MTLGKMREPVLHVECKNYDKGVSTKIVQNVVAKMHSNFKTAFLFVSNLNRLWSDWESMRTFFAGIKIELKKLYILVVSSAENQQPRWLEAISGHCFRPETNNTDGHLLVVFEVGRVEPDP
jgi:hypothetical protein